MSIRKSDTVILLSGKDKGKKGKVLEVFPDEGKMIVERMNVAKRHLKPTRNFQGGIIEKALPVPICKVMLVCPRCGEPARIRHRRVEEKTVRACARCDEIVDKV